MSYLGNIVSEKNINIQNKFINYTSTLDKIDINIPTLIIGWNFTKYLFKEKELSILENRIDDNLYWSFSKNEKRTSYENSINNFNNLIVSNILKSIKYYNINPLTIKYTTSKKILKFLQTPIEKHIYIHKNSFIYIYCKDFVIGLSLYTLEYMNISKTKILSTLYKNKNNIIFYDDSFLDKSFKNIIYNNRMIIPYFHSLTQN